MRRADVDALLNNGLLNTELSGITALFVDEICLVAWKKQSAQMLNIESCIK